MSKIEWTDLTWNPVTGCTKVSEGCRNCYAEKLTNRWKHSPHLNVKSKYAGGFENVTCHPDVLDEPLKRKKPTRYFVCSMSDLFHQNVSDRFISLVFATMRNCPQHTFMLLTKRPERMAAMSRKYYWMDLSNVWFGTSAENQKAADERIIELLKVRSSVRFVSLEPLLGPIHLDFYINTEIGVNWVIVGGESGPKARPLHPWWVRDIRKQCKGAHIPFFFKQWGEWLPTKYGGLGSKEFNWCEKDEPFQWMCRVGKKAAGNKLDGKTYVEFPATETVKHET